MTTGSDNSADPMGSSTVYYRSNSSPLASSETRLMLVIAARLPQSVTPNHMTALGLFGGILCLAGYVLSSRDGHWLCLAVFGYGVHWLGDGLDGNLARLRQIERPVFGAYLDQTVDVFAIGTTIIGLGLSPYVRLDIALFTMIPYLLLVLLRQMRAQVTGVDEIAHDGIGGSEGRIVMVLLTVAMMVIGPRPYTFSFGAFTGFDIVLAVIGGWGIAVFTKESIRILRHLSIIDPPRKAWIAEPSRTSWRAAAEDAGDSPFPEAFRDPLRQTSR
jgi:phosphatidylglycerophosphate synthase